MTVTDGGTGYTLPTVDFDFPDDPNGTQATGHVVCVVDGGRRLLTARTPTAHRLDRVGRRRQPGLRLHHGPGVAIRNGTQFDPIALPDGGTAATATGHPGAHRGQRAATSAPATPRAPTVTITDPTGTGTGAAATAVTDGGAITGVTVTDPGAGYLTPGMRKFVDDLPGALHPGPTAPTDGKYLRRPSRRQKYTDASVTQKPYNGVMADEYVIGLVQYRTTFSSDLPPTPWCAATCSSRPPTTPPSASTSR